MEENRKITTALALAGAALLLFMAGYPVVKEKISEHRKKDVFLAEEQSLGDREEIEEERKAGLEEKKETPAPEVAIEQEALPEVCFSLEGHEEDSEAFWVSMWRSNTGICYFFLPGFAKGRGLVLKTAPEGSIFIGDTEVKEGDVLRGISEERVYELLVPADGGEGLKCEAAFMYSSDLPVLSLTTASGSTDFIDEDKENQEEGSAALYGESGEKLYTGKMESLRGRGNSTWGLSKKPYQIKLCEDVDFFGFGEAASFNLLANGYDETRLRNQVALELASELEMKYVPDGKMIDLYINNCYYGNYFLTEKIRVDEGSVAIRDMEKLLEAVYSPQEIEKLTPGGNEAGTRKWVETGIDNDDLSGGYLLEREIESRFETEISGFVTDQGDCYTLQSPLYASEDQVNYIADLMQEFQDAVSKEDGIHPVTGKHYSEYIDVDSFIRKYLVEEISKNYDGGVTSSFFYKPEDSVSRKIFAGPVWDYDVAFGNCNLDRIASNPAGITRLRDHVYGTDVFAKLYEKEDFYGQMVKMYEEKALPCLNSLLAGGIDKMVLESRKSAEMDSIRWEELENRYQYYEEYDNDVRYLKYFIEKRRDFLSEVWLGGGISHTVTFVVDGEAWQLLCVRDGEVPDAELIPSRYSSLFMGWATKEGIPYDRYKPVYEDMTFYATWQELPVADVVLTE